MAGYSGRGIIQRQRAYARAERWVKRWGAFVIFGFNFVPIFPFDLMGIAAGALRFPLWKFFLICLAGRTLAYTVVACAGAGLDTIYLFLIHRSNTELTMREVKEAISIAV